MGTGREFNYTWQWDLPASAEALWPLVSDTNRFNRDAGLPPVQDATEEGEELPNARRKLRLKVKGVTLEWEELPFEWFRPWRFGVVRRYSKGPLEEMRVMAELEALEPSRTRLTYRVAARPRGFLGLLTTPLQIGVLSRRTFAKVFKQYARAVSARKSRVPPTPREELMSGPRLRRAEVRLKDAGVEPAVAHRLVDHIASSDDLTLARMRPYELADRWGMERKVLLRACLLGTREGILDLSWDIMCPVCRGTKDRAETLRRLRTGVAHCDTCQVDFSPDFDQAVEISFRPSEALREVEAPPFCVAGPQISPHVEVQQLLAAGEERVVHPILDEGRHRARAFGTSGGPSFMVAEGGRDTATLRISGDRWDNLPEEPLAPEVRLTLINDTDRELLLDVERMVWADTAATAAEVTAMADFRDLFDSEVLEVGDLVRVGSLAVLFTDLKASTRLYREIGDAPAFRKVMDHFHILEDAIRAHDGAVVKTIGDAVMAVFQDPAEGARAALRIHDDIHAAEAGLVLKAGLHYGACIAVNLNDRLDYFGTTVNVAARLGSLSGGGELIVSDVVADDLEVRAIMDSHPGVCSETLEAIHGLDEPMGVCRIQAVGVAPSRRTPAGS